MKPSLEYCDEATKLHSMPVVIDWHRVDESVLKAADLSSLASGSHYKPLSPENLEIVRGSMAPGGKDLAAKIAKAALRKKSKAPKTGVEASPGSALPPAKDAARAGVAEPASSEAEVN